MPDLIRKLKIWLLRRQLRSVEKERAYAMQARMPALQRAECLARLANERLDVTIMLHQLGAPNDRS